MLKRLLSFVVIIAAILTVGLSPSGNNVPTKRNEKDRVLSVCDLPWPTELTPDDFPALTDGIDFYDETEEAITIKRRVYSYENYLKYLNSFAMADLGAVTLSERRVPLECIYYAFFGGMRASVIYYSDETMPEFNIVIVLEKPLNL